MKIVSILDVLATIALGLPESKVNKEGRLLGLGIKSKLKNLAHRLFRVFEENSEQPEFENNTKPSILFWDFANPKLEYTTEQNIMYWDRRTEEPKMKYATEPNDFLEYLGIINKNFIITRNQKLLTIKQDTNHKVGDTI